MNLDQIRLNEGIFDIPEIEPQKFHITEELCPLAERVTVNAPMLYKCKYKYECDWQLGFANRNTYCGKEL